MRELAHTDRTFLNYLYEDPSSAVCLCVCSSCDLIGCLVQDAVTVKLLVIGIELFNFYVKFMKKYQCFITQSNPKLKREHLSRLSIVSVVLFPFKTLSRNKDFELICGCLEFKSSNCIVYSNQILLKLKQTLGITVLINLHVNAFSYKVQKQCLNLKDKT